MADPTAHKDLPAWLQGVAVASDASRTPSSLWFLGAASLVQQTANASLALQPRAGYLRAAKQRRHFSTKHAASQSWSSTSRRSALMPQTAAPVAAQTAWVGPTGAAVLAARNTPRNGGPVMGPLELPSPDLVAHAHPMGARVKGDSVPQARLFTAMPGGGPCQFDSYATRRAGCSALDAGPSRGRAVGAWCPQWR
jgi:hypothetical protein